MFRWPLNLVRRILGSLLLLALLLAGAEVALRILEIQKHPLVSPRKTSPLEAITVPSWTARLELKPLATVRVRPAGADTPHIIRINSHGLRGPEVDVPKPPIVYRILALGDEALLASALPENQTLVGHLQNELQPQTSLSVEVCNAGVPGGCPLTAYLLLTRRLALLQPDLVILTVSETDLADDFACRRYVRIDERGNPLACRHPSLGLPPKSTSLAAWRREFRLIDLALQFAGDAWKRHTAFDDLDEVEGTSPRLNGLSSDPSTIERALKPLIPLAAWCRLNYAPLCVLHPIDSESTASDSPFSAALREMAASQQFLCVEVPRSAPAGPATSWSAEEHRVFSQVLAQRLAAELPGPWNSPYFQPELKLGQRRPDASATRR